MRLLPLIAALSASTLLASALSSPAQQLPTPEASSPRLVLLRNGETLTGTVTHAGQRYLVTLPTAQIRLRADEVQCVCDDLEEAHAALSAKAHPQDVAAQIKLAQWCLKQALHDQAAAHLDTVERLAPDDARASMLRRQLDLLVERPAATHASPIATATVEQSSETTLGGLSAGVMESFVTSVQPLLLNQCASGACHGARSPQAWKVVRVSSGRARSRRLTLRNLEACLQMIDRESPQASLLLSRAATAHGDTTTVEAGREVAGAPLRESQYQLLVEWVLTAAKSDRRQPASVADRRIAPAVEAAPRPLPPPGGPGPQRTEAELTALRSRSAAPLGSSQTAEDAPGSDHPLDPATFNRRFVKPAAPPDDEPSDDDEH